jgi:hypothetical protein
MLALIETYEVSPACGRISFLFALDEFLVAN